MPSLNKIGTFQSSQYWDIEQPSSWGSGWKDRGKSEALNQLKNNMAGSTNAGGENFAVVNVSFAICACFFRMNNNRSNGSLSTLRFLRTQVPYRPGPKIFKPWETIFPGFNSLFMSRMGNPRPMFPSVMPTWAQLSYTFTMCASTAPLAGSPTLTLHMSRTLHLALGFAAGRHTSLSCATGLRSRLCDRS